MHELSIAQSIVDAVETQANAYNAIHVTGVQLRIGEASGIMIDSLSYCFEMLASLDPLLEHAKLSIDVVPYTARCHACAQEFHIEDFIPCCPICAEWSSDIVSGTELQIQEMEFENAPASSH